MPRLHPARYSAILFATLVMVASCVIPPKQPDATVSAAAAALIEHVSPSRSVFQLHDSAGHTMDTLKVVADPDTTGRYIGVHHWLSDGSFSVAVATSTDLRTWIYRRTLDRAASQPSIAFGPAPAHQPVVGVEA